MEKELSQFFLHAKSPDGRRHVCIECASGDRSTRQTKTCNMCGLEKPIGEFYRSARSPDGRQYRCKPCAVASARKWATEHPDRHLDNMHRYMRTEKYMETRRALRARKKEELRQQRRDWYARNSKMVRARTRARRASDPEFRERENMRARQWRDANRHKRFQWQLKSVYGLTWDQYQEMIVSQLGRCAICQEQCDLVVDHDHTTGAVRGLLCARCNNGLGHFRDNPRFIINAVGYLERNRDVA